MTSARRSGVLLHPTSLPGPAPIGDLGREAFQFVDFLSFARQSLWQILPLGPTGAENSPYNARSTFAGNPLLISLERLAEHGFLDRGFLGAGSSRSLGRVDFDAARVAKQEALGDAFTRFQISPPPGISERFQAFCREEADWLDDYALFEAIHDRFEGRTWLDWDEGLAKRDPNALRRWHEEHQADVEYQRFVQFLFALQWSDIKNYANGRGIAIVGDIPIYVSLDSADVWSNQPQFLLDDAGRPLAVAGVPPDLFSATGQLWGNPLYRWDVMAKDGYSWWVERFRRTLELCDIVRVDHFRGFQAGWQVPASESTAVRGRWIDGPGDALFARVLAELRELPIIVEDLGIITREVDELRERLGYPGMKVLQFAFGGDSDNPYLPHTYEPNSVVYTGTHDNDTTAGWYHSANDNDRDHVNRYLGGRVTDISWELIRLAMSSVSSLCIVPMQDVLALDSCARMNTPGTVTGNWRWRLEPGAVQEHHARVLADLTALYGRDPRTARPRWS